MLTNNYPSYDVKKPYSESCDQNKEVILSVLKPLLAVCSSVLEIGSGTGQHAVYFADKLPHISWQTSDCQPYLAGINAWISETGLPNLKEPFELDVSRSDWPSVEVDAIFTANSVHIMHETDVVNLIQGSAKVLKPKGSLIIYGPFNYAGDYTSESNARFDQWLKDRDTLSGIKHFEDVDRLAESNGLKLVEDYSMPANNRILHYIKD